MKKTVQFAACLACIALCGNAFSQDWPQWRGVNRDAKAEGFKAPGTWPKTLEKQWKVTVGDGVATPALVGDKLYVFTRQGPSEILRCLDAASGKELWQDKYDAQGANGPAQSFPGPRCSPTVVDGKVITLGVRGTLSCHDAASGKLLWRKDDIKGWPRFFTSSSPIVIDGLCIAQLGGNDNGSLVAYNVASGEEKWRWKGDSPAYASPALMTVGDAKLIFAETERKIVAIHAKDGKLAWETDFVVTGRGYNAASPIVDGTTLIYTGSNRGTKAVKFESAGDKVTAKELWSNKEKSVMYNTPVLKGKHVYGLSQTSELFCIDAVSGKTTWTVAAGAAPAAAPGGGGVRPMRGGNSGGYGSIVDAGPVLVALTPSSQLIVFEPAAEAFSEKARIKVADSPTYAYPIVSGKRIFIKDQDSVTLWTLP